MPSQGTQGSVSKRQDCSVTEAENGPQPMKDYKPAKTTPNSADQFRQTHEAQYEERERPSNASAGASVERARRHYAAYPALGEELDKRRSTTRVTAVRARRGMTSGSLCSVCQKLRRRRVRKNILRSRGQGRRNRRYRTPEKQYRSSKNVREIYRHRKRDANKYTGYSSPRKGVTSPREASVSVDGNKSSSDVGSLKNPSTAEGSVSSYHSYPSIDHEPMVS